MDNDTILSFNEKHIDEGLDHENLQVATIKYLSDQRKHRYELFDEPKKQPNRTFIDEELAIKIVMDSITTLAHKFRAKLGLKEYDVILTKERSVLTKMKSSFKRENMQTQYSFLGYKIDLYFHNCKLAIKIDENNYIDCELKRQKKNKNLVVSLLELILKMKTSLFLKLSMTYMGTSNNRLIN